MSVTIQIKGTETTFDIPTDIPATLEGEQIITLVDGYWKQLFTEDGEVKPSIKVTKLATQFIRKYFEMRSLSIDVLPSISVSDVIEVLRRCQVFFGE